jgi:hypothetical protein
MPLMFLNLRYKTSEADEIQSIDEVFWTTRFCSKNAILKGFLRTVWFERQVDCWTHAVLALHGIVCDQPGTGIARESTA